MTVLDSDCQGARRCLNDALALLGAHTEEGTAEDPVANGVFHAGGLARWHARRTITYIDTHLDSRLEVPTLARLVSFSMIALNCGFADQSHLNRSFRRVIGVSPGRWRRINVKMASKTSGSSERSMAMRAGGGTSLCNGTPI